jgi:hypothetical protein
MLSGPSNTVLKKTSSFRVLLPHSNWLGFFLGFKERADGFVEDW